MRRIPANQRTATGLPLCVLTFQIDEEKTSVTGTLKSLFQLQEGGSSPHYDHHESPASEDVYFNEGGLKASLRKSMKGKCKKLTTHPASQLCQQPGLHGPASIGADHFLQHNRVGVGKPKWPPSKRSCNGHNQKNNY